METSLPTDSVKGNEIWVLDCPVGQPRPAKEVLQGPRGGLVVNKGRSSPTGEVLTVGSPKRRSKRSRSSAPEEVRKGKEEVLTCKGGPDGWISKGEIGPSNGDPKAQRRWDVQTIRTSHQDQAVHCKSDDSHSIEVEIDREDILEDLGRSGGTQGGPINIRGGPRGHGEVLKDTGRSKRLGDLDLRRSGP
uniref:Uncharacterized protein n=1 Tax=Phyllostachys edulis TaxID=38705 RepID=D3IVF5_PHYED|nr:hypothetical protein [Phyllostachys edulis]